MTRKKKRLEEKVTFMLFLVKMKLAVKNLLSTCFAVALIFFVIFMNT